MEDENLTDEQCPEIHGLHAENRGGELTRAAETPAAPEAAEQAAGSEERKYWHQGYYGAMELDLRRHREHLEFTSEVELGKLPPRLDLRIIKKEKDYVVDEDFGEIYRTYNIHEYKSERDALNIDELSQATAYAYLVKHLGHSEDEIPMDEITVSLFRRAYPRELFQKLEQYNIKVTKHAEGIYYIEGFSAFPTQVVVMKQIDKRHAALRALGKSISDEEIIAFSEAIRDLTDPYDLRNARAVLNVAVAANEEKFQRIWRGTNMYEAVFSIFRENIENVWQEGKREGRQEGRQEGRKEGAADAFSEVAERMIKEGMPGNQISAFTNLGRKEIDGIAQQLKKTVNWSDATGA